MVRSQGRADRLHADCSFRRYLHSELACGDGRSIAAPAFSCDRLRDSQLRAIVIQNASVERFPLIGFLIHIEVIDDEPPTGFADLASFGMRHAHGAQHGVSESLGVSGRHEHACIADDFIYSTHIRGNDRLLQRHGFAGRAAGLPMQS